MKINADLFEANYLHAFLLTENYITLTVSFTCSSHILLLLDSSIVYSNLFLSCSVPLISLLSGLDRLFFASFNITQRCIRYSMLHISCWTAGGLPSSLNSEFVGIKGSRGSSFSSGKSCT